MRRAALFVLLSIALVPAAAATFTPAERVGRAVHALGGERLRALKTIAVRGRAKHWEPDQSYVAGGEMRFAGDSTFAQYRDFAAGAARTDWERRLVYPSTRRYRYSEVFVRGEGYVIGVDSTARLSESLQSDPPRHRMSGFRAAATARELERSSARLLVDMAVHPGRVAALPDQAAGARRLPALRYRGETADFLVLFDPETGLPERVRTRDADALQGDSDYDLVLADWRDVGGLRYPFEQRYELNGRTVIEIRIEEVSLEPALEASRFDIPLRPEPRAKALKPVRATPYQWFIRRQFIGVLLDSDAISYDPQASAGPRLVDIAPGVAHWVGGTHNSLFVEMDRFLVVFDAPLGDFYSRQAMAAAAKRFGGKPVRYVVLTHHHMDHTSGVRAYAAAGATLVVGQGDRAFFERVLASPHALTTDGPRGRIEANIVEVGGRWSVSDGRREVHAYLIENPHAAGYLLGYVPDAKLGFVTDLWNPGRDPLPPHPTPALKAVADGVKRWGLSPERFAGGHGAVAPYAELAKLAAD